VRPTIDGDVLTGGKAYLAGDRDQRRAHVDGGTYRRGARGADYSNDCGFEVRARVDHDRLASGRIGHGGLQEEVDAVGVEAVGGAGTPIDHGCVGCG